MKLVGTPVKAPISIPKEPLLYKGRPLDKEEIEAEDKAEHFPKGKFARINPMPGTIGFTFRNLKGRNSEIIGYLELYLVRNKPKREGTFSWDLKVFVANWRKWDIFSKNRIDIFDWFCKENGIDPAKMFGAIHEGFFSSNDMSMKIDMISYKTQLLEDVVRFSKNEGNFRDRELLSKATGLHEDKGTEINVDASSSTQVNNLSIEGGGFSSIIRRNEKLIREQNSEQTKQLTKGSSNYVDAEFEELDDLEKEKIYVSN